MPIDHTIIGMQSPPATFEVERGAIRKLARAIDDQTPEYQRGEIAPPTFPTTFRMDDVPWFKGVDRSTFIHTNQEYEYERPMVAGDVITVVERIVDVFQKEGKLGQMTFIVSESEGRDPAGRLVYRARSTRLTH
ncbi:MAG: MaoC family dehydratase N-terminal domain-containing protein [Chloroflexota bacterium]